MTLTTFLAFLLAQTLAAAVPGPTVMPVISQAMRFGWKRSLFGTIGVCSANVSLQFFILGSMVIVIELLVLWFYGWAADKSARLLPHGKAIQYQNRAAGLVLISAGIWFATLKR